MSTGMDLLRDENIEYANALVDTTLLCAIEIDEEYRWINYSTLVAR